MGENAFSNISWVFFFFFGERVCVCGAARRAILNNKFSMNITIVLNLQPKYKQRNARERWFHEKQAKIQALGEENPQTNPPPRTPRFSRFQCHSYKFDVVIIMNKINFPESKLYLSKQSNVFKRQQNYIQTLQEIVSASCIDSAITSKVWSFQISVTYIYNQEKRGRRWSFKAEIYSNFTRNLLDVFKDEIYKTSESRSNLKQLKGWSPFAKRRNATL